MKKYTVNFYDYTKGAKSAIDTIEVEDNYTPEQYIEDCMINDYEFAEMLQIQNGEVTFEEIEG